MARPGARPGDRKALPLPAATTTLPVRRVFSHAEMARLRDGLVPEEMEDKWFVVWTGEALDFHRSWTGAHIYRVTFEPAPFGEAIATAVASADPSAHRAAPGWAARLLPWLCDALLLGRDVTFPASEHLAVPRVTAVVGDITRAGCDVVVNAANSALAGGGGVDGAIHRAAGPALADACRALPVLARGARCPTGEARVTPAFALPGARWIVHAVGPIYQGAPDDARLLRGALDAALDAAVLHGATTVAVPALSCGAFRYPLADAAAIAVAAARTPRALDEIRFVLFDAHTHAAWQRALDAAPAP